MIAYTVNFQFTPGKNLERIPILSKLKILMFTKGNTTADNRQRILLGLANFLKQPICQKESNIKDNKRKMPEILKQLQNAPLVSVATKNENSLMSIVPSHSSLLPEKAKKRNFNP